MLRLLAPGLLGFVFFVLWVYCILDVIATDESLIRNLPKVLWLAVVVFVPTIGSLAWLGLGRPVYAGWYPGDTRTRSARPTYRGPEDRPGFGNREDEFRQREADRRRREEELRRREAEGTDGDR